MPAKEIGRQSSFPIRLHLNQCPVVFNGMNVGCVYKIHFPKGAFYIGQTSNAKKRMKAHMRGLEDAWKNARGYKGEVSMYAKIFRYIISEQLFWDGAFKAYFEILIVNEKESERIVWENKLLYENRDNDKCLNYGFTCPNICNEGVLGLA